MNFVKKHKILLIVIGIIIIFLVMGLFFIKQFMVDYSKDLYGDRLKNIEKVEVKENAVKKLESELGSIEAISKVNYHLQGRLINIMIIIKAETTIDDAKSYANKVLDYFEEDEKKYYDIQIFLKNENEEIEGYPLIGYKHKTSETLVWKQ